MKEKNNILIFEGNKKVGFGGGQRVSFNVAKSLIDDFNVFISFFDENDKLLELFNGLGVESFFLRSGKSKNSVGNLYSFSKEIVSLLLFLPLNIFRMLNFLNKRELKNTNTIIYIGVKEAVLLGALLKLFKYRVIYHNHTLDSSKKWSFIFNFIIEKFDCIFCVSKKVLEGVSLPQAVLLYNSTEFLPVERKRERLFNDRLIVGFVGSLQPEKGVLELVQEISGLVGVELVVVGTGPLKDRLKLEGVKLTGFLSNVEEFLDREIDVLVLPTLIEESFGLVIIEAGIKGIPVFTQNLGGQSEVLKLIQSSSQLFLFKEQGSLRSLISNCDCNYDTYAKVAFSGVKIIKRTFSLETFEKELKLHIHRILAL